MYNMYCLTFVLKNNASYTQMIMILHFYIIILHNDRKFICAILDKLQNF